MSAIYLLTVMQSSQAVYRPLACGLRQSYRGVYKETVKGHGDNPVVFS
jgi:hypothetical protein